jgi:hypothetical protein
MEIISRMLGKKHEVLLCKDFIQRSFLFGLNLIVKSFLFLRLFLLFLFDVFLRVFNQEKLLFSFHLSADVAAVKCPIPFLLVFLGLELHVDIKSFFVLLD